MKGVNFYQNLISDEKKRLEKWLDEAAECKSLYKTERRYNVLYANTDLLLSALVTNNPKPVIRVRFAKQNAENPAERNLARTCGEVAERAVIYNNDNFDLRNAISDAALETLLTGRGVLRVCYEPTIETKKVSEPFFGPSGETLGVVEEEQEEIVTQKVTLQSVAYKDFLCSPVSDWSKVWWGAFKHLMSREELVKRFGPEAEEVPLSLKETPGGKSAEGKEIKEVAAVWEVWDKNEKSVSFVVEGYPKMLAQEEDPYGLEGFFPVARPLQFVHGEDMTPVPEYRLYKRTAEELTQVVKRIDENVKNIRSRAFYAAKYKDEMARLDEAEDNTSIPIDANVAELAQNGGIGSLVAEFPNAGKSQVLSVLEARKQSALAEIYDITGIADIMRGVSDAAETAAAQRIKGQFGSVRLRARQTALQCFIRDAFRLAAELVCEHFTPEILQQICVLDLPTDEQKAQFSKAQQMGQMLPPAALEALNKPTWSDILQVLRKDRLRNYTLEVESSGTIFDDTEENKAQRLDLFKNISALLSQSLPFMQGNPEFIDAIKDNVLYVVDAFPQSRVLKESFENAFAAWEARIKRPAPAQPTPDQIIAQAEQLKAQAELMSAQARQAEAQAKIIQAGEKLNLDKAKLAKDTAKDVEDLKIKRAQLDAEIAKLQAQNWE